MKDLIEALNIFSKYVPEDGYSPTTCEHEELFVQCDPRLVSPEDVRRLRELSFNANGDLGNFSSMRFGSC